MTKGARGEDGLQSNNLTMITILPTTPNYINDYEYIIVPIVIIIHFNTLFFACLLLFFFIILSGLRLSPLGTAATTSLLYQPQMVDDDDCGAKW
jgi:hypothetical protein